MMYPVLTLLLSSMQTGRAAMLGFVAAVVAEVTTGQSVWSQVCAHSENQLPPACHMLGYYSSNHHIFIPHLNR